MRKPRRPRVLREIDAAIVAALDGIKGVVYYTHGGVDMAGGMKVIVRIAVDAREQGALMRWVAASMKR